MKRLLLIMLMMVALVGAAIAPAGVAMAATGSRNMPESVNAGASFDIDITASDYGAIAQVTETLPAGFSYVSSTLLPAAVVVDGRVVKFHLLGETSFSYTVTASGTEGTYSFSGTLKDQDLGVHAIGGNTRIEVTTTPATPTPVPTQGTPTVTATPEPTAVPPTPTPVSTIATPTPTPVPTEGPTPTPVVTEAPTDTPAPTIAPTASPVQTPGPTATSPEDDDEGTNIWVILGPILAVVAIAGLVYLLMMQRRGRESGGGEADEG